MKYLIIILLLAACQQAPQKEVQLTAETKFIINNPKLANEILNTPAVRRPWSGMVKLRDTVPKPRKHPLVLSPEDSSYFKLTRLSDTMRDAVLPMLFISNPPYGAEWQIGVKDFAIRREGGFKLQGDPSLEYIIEYTSMPGQTERLAYAFENADTLTIDERWPMVRQTPRVIKAFGKTYKISD